MSHDDRRGVLERSLANLTIGVASSIRSRERNLRDTRQGEWENQIHLELAGHATSDFGTGEQTVIFNVPLMPAPSQRLVPFDTPHFTYGIEMTKTSGALFIITVHVTGWTINEFGWYCGATLLFGVQAPLAPADTAIDYAAIAHLSFQGYGCIPEGDEFQ